MMSRTPRTMCTCLALALSLMSASVAFANPPLLGESFPYTATLSYADGDPVEGVFDITVQIFEAAGGGDLLAYQEEHVGVAVVDGELALSLGNGQSWNYASLWAVLERSGPWTVGFLVDGVALGGKVPLGSVPFAGIGLRIPSNGVLYGGAHGYVPAEAVEPTVRVLHGWYMHGDDLPVPNGWRCEHVANVVDTSAALSMGSDGLHGQDLFVASVGPSPVDVLPGLTVDFSSLPGTPGVAADDSVVQVRHAYSNCTYVTWNPSCVWSVQAALAALSVEVRSTCVPE